VTGPHWQTARLDEIQPAGRFWVPIRKRFGIGAFGVNAWIAEAEGDEIVGEHAEDTGHEELYVVIKGRATFTVGGAEIDALAGTIVFVRDPETVRGAVAREAGTTILTVGAKPGEPFEVSNWEANAEMWPLYEAGDYDGAKAVLIKALERGPDTGLLYNLACIEARLGRSEEAIEHLRQALEGAPDGFARRRGRTRISSRSGTIRASSSCSLPEARLHA
jgi:tetratricopeptide (TPR) repeat protein